MKKFINSKEFSEILDIKIENFNKQFYNKRIPDFDFKVGNTRLWRFDTVLKHLLELRKEVDDKIEKLQLTASKEGDQYE